MSGIRVSAEMKQDFVALQADPSVFGIQIDIANSTFVKKATVKDTADVKANFQAVQQILDTRLPSYVLFRSPRIEGKWVCMFYCPSSAPVRGRMIFASSVNSLKDGFGSSSIVGDYHATDVSECTLSEYLHQFAINDDPEALMTREEAEQDAAEFESAMSAGRGPTKISTDIPVNVGDEVLGSLQGFASGEHSTVVLKINTKSETILLVHAGDVAFSGLAEHLPAKEARYVVHAHSYIHEEKKTTKPLFFFYCPEGAKPRHKMIYATVKSKVVSMCVAENITGMKAIELSSTSDLTEENVYEDIHPRVVKTVKLVKPKANRARGRRGLHSKAKFTARTK